MDAVIGNRRVGVMRELLRADWYRTVKGRVLLLAAGGTAAATALLVLAMIDPGADFVAVGPGIPGAYLTIAGFVSAVVCGVSAEHEYVRGGARNKLVPGHTRSQAYTASYIINTLVAYIVAFTYLGVLLAGTAWWAEYLEPETTAEAVLLGLPAVAAFTALYTLTGVTWRKRGTAVTCLIVFIVLYLISALAAAALNEPEFIQDMAFEAETAGITMSRQVRNPYYITGPLRTLCVFLDNFLPTGQAWHVEDGVVSVYAPLWAAACWAVCLITGKEILSRSDLQ